MQDRVPLYPGRVTLTPVSGQANTYDMVMADQPQAQGTPLNKATFLKDATAALYGLTNAVPNDVFAFVGKDFGNMWVWEKEQGTDIEVKTDITSYDPGNHEIIDDSHRTLQYSSSVISDGNGNPVLVNPITVTIENSTTGAMEIASYAPCYIKSAYDGEIYYLPTGTTGGYANNNTVYYVGSMFMILLSTNASVKAKKVSFYTTYTAVGYVLTHTSTPPDETGYTFKSKGQLGNKAQIATGSYVGTGTYGSSNPNSLTFDFDPKFLWVGENIGNYSFGNLVWKPGNRIASFISGSAYINISKTDRTITWYGSNGYANVQLNTANQTYTYLAIG